MLQELFAGFDYYSWIVLPIIIFFSRLTDVSLGTLRHVFISKGYRKIVPVLGFFEVLIWIIVVAQVMQNLSNWVCYIAYAGGFATGTYVGLRIEEKLALGLQVVRIITKQNCDILIRELREENYGVTVVDAEGSSGSVKMIFTIVKRKNVKIVIEKIKINNPNAFYSVEDIKDTSQGIFTKTPRFNLLFRKSK
ncbi:MAG: DUF2179 domain-containing protein [Flavobacteriales bacterium]|nr:DUF2179 domain-containing protein [Flavobacteriales bacterium]MCB9334574.1 DUF2179 domain-containing protein [Flavobacteriales bacterium]